MKDWKDHSLDTLGPLYLHEILTVRRGSQIKEYGVHVFENALIFIAEETESDSKTLHLKGRLYMKSITEAMKIVSPEEMRIEISIDGKRGVPTWAVALLFQEENKLDVWRDLIVLLAAKAKAASASDESGAAVLCQQPVEGHAESKPTENISEKHNIPRTNDIDVESQTAEEKIQHDDVKVGHRRWGMVIMLLCTLTL